MDRSTEKDGPTRFTNARFERIDEFAHAALERKERARRWSTARCFATLRDCATNQAAMFVFEFSELRERAANAELLDVAGVNATQKRIGENVESFLSETTPNETPDRFVSLVVRTLGDDEVEAHACFRRPRKNVARGKGHKLRWDGVDEAFR